MPHSVKDGAGNETGPLDDKFVSDISFKKNGKAQTSIQFNNPNKLPIGKPRGLLTTNNK
jgi:hypothetical protein